MLNTLDILEILRLRVAERTGTGTDYRIAKELGCTPSAVHGWKTRYSIEARYAIKIAGYCGIDARYLVACVEYEKAQDEAAREFWRSLAADFQPPPEELPARAA